MIKIFKTVIRCIAIVSCISYSCFAQNDISGNFKNYSLNTIQEKLFVHTDRSAYLTGEIIWFKIYAVDGSYNKPIDLNKVAYVEILDSKQTSVLQAKIALNNGSGSGSLFIPVTLGNGNYKLRAYTSWMKNFSPDYFFEKALTIINPQIAPDVATKKTNSVYDIQFFPEGGNLISGLQSKVAVKAVGADGKGVDFKGAVIDEKNDTVARFSSLKFGMGQFLLTPAQNSTYKAVIRVANNAPVTKSLPPIVSQGYVMQLTDNEPGKLLVTVSSNVDQDSKVYAFAHSRQLVKVFSERDLRDGKASFVIDKNVLDEGISHITIFNSQRQPVCERLYFKRPINKLVIDAVADGQQYGNRKKVNIAVTSKNQTGNPVSANFSMSVYRMDGLQTADEGDILSYLWLSSDLHGRVESAGYYFTNNTAEANEAVDNLMLTQGWRRFDWSNVLKNKVPVFNFFPEAYGHTVAGTVVNSTTNAPAGGIVAYFAVPGKRVQLYTSKSDSLGHVFFNTKNFHGTEIVVQTNPKVDSTYRIDIIKPFSEQYSSTPLPAFNISPDMQQAVETRYLGMQVQNIYAGDKIKQIAAVKDTLPFYAYPSHSYNLDDYTRFTTMEEVLREYVKEVNIVRSQNKYHIKMLGETGFLTDPMVLVDGLPVFDGNKIMAIDPLSIKKLEALPKRYFLGPATLEGVLSYTSYKGNVAGVEMDPHAVVLDYEGLQLQRVFYSPVYDTDTQVRSRVPDFRNLLFWSPSVTANSKTGVSFYTSDQEGKYLGVVQGITANGEAASKTFTFEVKK